MAYKIEGVASEDCDIYVINAATDQLDKVQSVIAGAYEVPLLSMVN